MTGPTHGRQPEPPHPPGLDYGRPSGGLSRGVQLTLGVVIALAVMFPATFFGPVVLGMAGAFVGPLLGIAIVGSAAVTLRESDRTRAIAAGMWTGVGIAVLVDGVCWIAITST